MARITIVTAGHPSTCPRMVKAADALAEAGHAVRVVCARFLAWASEADRDLLARRRWRVRVVNHDRHSARWRSRLVSARRQAALALVSAAGARPAPWGAVTRAFTYAHPELVKAALEEPADLFYGGTSGALAAVAAAARHARRPYGLDLEDLHTAESDAADAPRQHALAARVLSRVLPNAAFVTTSAPLIADAYTAAFGVRPVVIHNTFPLPAAPPPLSAGLPIRLYWFSQTVGPRRGLEEAIRAAGLAGVDAVLTVRGLAAPAVARDLRQLVAEVAPRLRLEVAPPIPPDYLAEDARKHHIGICGETSPVQNRQRCLTNKLFTYLQAGLAVALAATPAHVRFAAGLGPGACVYPADDPARLAAWLAALARDPEQLAAARRAAWQAAARRWHWEHPEERGRLVQVVEAAL